MLNVLFLVYCYSQAVVWEVYNGIMISTFQVYLYMVLHWPSKFAPSEIWPPFGYREWKIVFGKITLW